MRKFGPSLGPIGRFGLSQATIRLGCKCCRLTSSNHMTIQLSPAVTVVVVVRSKQYFPAPCLMYVISRSLVPGGSASSFMFCVNRRNMEKGYILLGRLLITPPPIVSQQRSDKCNTLYISLPRSSLRIFFPLLISFVQMASTSANRSGWKCSSQLTVATLRRDIIPLESKNCLKSDLFFLYKPWMIFPRR